MFFSVEVSRAFAKGMTFDELARFAGEPFRFAEVKLTPEDAAVLRRIEEYDTSNEKTEVPRMLKTVYGLKDAPSTREFYVHRTGLAS